MHERNVFQLVTRNSELPYISKKKSSSIRNVGSQIIVTILSNLVGFTYGSLTGFTALMLAELSQENSDIEITKDELSWFGSYLFMSPFGALLVGLLSHSIGSRMVLLVTSIIYTTSCIIFYFATNSAMFLVPQAFIGLMIPTTISSGTTYITEIAQPHLRSPLTTSGYLCISLGALFTMLMSQFFKWKIIAIIIAIISTMGFLGMLFAPNSPYWLARKGRFDEAEVALAWLRGWTTLDNVRTEFLTLKEAHIEEKSKDVKSQKRPIRVLMKPYMEKSLWIPMCLVIYISIMFKLTGSEMIETYNVVIFRINETPFDIKIAGAMYEGGCIIGAIVCMFSINTLGKRKLLFMSLIGAGTAYLIIAIVVHLIKLEIGNSSGYLFWIPPVLLIFASFILSMGIDKVAYMLNSELLPNKFRDIGVGVSALAAEIVLAMLHKGFLYMVDAMTIQGVFLFFGINCIIALVTFYFIVPETEGKTLIEIQDHFADKKSQTIKI